MYYIYVMMSLQASSVVLMVTFVCLTGALSYPLNQASNYNGEERAKRSIPAKTEGSDDCADEPSEKKKSARMRQIFLVPLGVCFFLIICNARAAVLQDDSEDSLDGYAADDNLRNAIMAVLAGETDKRGFRCRPGYTYQSVLRQCVPSLGALRGRGGRRQG